MADGKSIDRNLFKKFVQVANPDAQVTVKPTYKQRERFEEHDLTPAPAAPVIDKRRQTANVLKNALVTQAHQNGGPISAPAVSSNAPNSVGYIMELDGMEGYNFKPQTAHSAAPNVSPRSSTGSSMKTLFESLGEAMSAEVGGGFYISEDATQAGMHIVTFQHTITEGEVKSVIRVVCHLNQNGEQSSSEVTVNLHESLALTQTVRRNYATQEALREDFAGLFRAAQENLND